MVYVGGKELSRVRSVFEKTEEEMVMRMRGQRWERRFIGRAGYEAEGRV